MNMEHLNLTGQPHKALFRPGIYMCLGWCVFIVTIHDQTSMTMSLCSFKILNCKKLKGWPESVKFLFLTLTSFQTRKDFCSSSKLKVWERCEHHYTDHTIIWMAQRDMVVIMLYCLTMFLFRLENKIIYTSSCIFCWSYHFRDLKWEQHLVAFEKVNLNMSVTLPTVFLKILPFGLIVEN